MIIKALLTTCALAVLPVRIPSQECNLSVWMSGGDMLVTCPSGGCGAEQCFYFHGTSVPPGTTISYCACENGGQPFCNTKVKVKDKVATITCLNPCPESCDQHPVTESPGVPCFCDN